jgi:hypothetical protein
MYFWEPNDNQMFMLFVIASIWAIADVIWQSQMIGIISHLLVQTTIDSFIDVFSYLHGSLYGK